LPSSAIISGDSYQSGSAVSRFQRMPSPTPTSSSSTSATTPIFFAIGHEFRVPPRAAALVLQSPSFGGDWRHDAAQDATQPSAAARAPPGGGRSRRDHGRGQLSQAGAGRRGVADAGRRRGVVLDQPVWAPPS